MSKVTLNKLGLKFKSGIKEVKVGEEVIEVKDYLPIADKVQFIQYVINNALDETTGCFSPVRVEIYFNIAICKWYSNISFTEKQIGQDIYRTYDLLDSNGIIDAIMSEIPPFEFESMTQFVEDTVKDISKYNISAAGIIQSMSLSSEDLNSRLSQILSNIQTSEGQQALYTLKDMVESN